MTIYDIATAAGVSASTVSRVINHKSGIRKETREKIEKLIEERQAARKAKNFARADEIRKELADKGIILEDTRQGVTWKRV